MREALSFYWQLYLERAVPVVVYQMGKVGSSSVYESLWEHGVRPVYHVHRMDPENIRSVRREHRDAGQDPPGEKTGERIYRHVVKRRKEAKFITLVRDPVRRNMSAFFENYRRFTGEEYREGIHDGKELADLFVRGYRHQVPLTWFDVEMKRTLGIDVFDYDFPGEDGHLSIRKGVFELLILKSEIDDSVKERAISHFLKVKDFRIKRRNVSRRKVYAETYREFVRDISLPEAYVNMMCDSKYTKHFYSDKEIEAIRSKYMSRK